MNKEELKEWLLFKFNDCYPAMYNDFKSYIYMVYDENYIRHKKLCRILNKNITQPNNPNGVYLFVINTFNPEIIVEFEYIYEFITKILNTTYIETIIFIHDILKDNEFIKNIFKNDNFLVTYGTMPKVEYETYKTYEKYLHIKNKNIIFAK